MISNKLLAVLFLLAFMSCHVVAQKGVLVEAESFENKGGWVLDQQFIDQMGSPFLLAHGLGKPVADAKTNIAIPRSGEWYVYVRTWNWCSPWTKEQQPGLFSLTIDGVKLPNDLGTGNSWNWEYAGSVELKKGVSILTLQDHTGFAGRCDAIFLTQEKGVKIPNEGERMYQFRKKSLGVAEKPRDGGTYDLVVVGAGTAGLATAVTAARQGLRVALIHNRPVVGGNNSKEIRVTVAGDVMLEPFPKLGMVVDEIGNIYQSSYVVNNILKSELNLSFFPDMHVFKVDQSEGKINSVTAKHIENSEEVVFNASFFADCTGDANVGYLAGAEFRIGREARYETRETLAPDRPDNMVYGATIIWKSELRDAVVGFPVCDWAVQLTDESCYKVTESDVFWEAGFNKDQIEEAELIRDHLFRAIYGNWAFLKNKSRHKEEYTNRELSLVGYIAGKRESRRLLGDVLFTQLDIEGAYVKYDDAIVTGTFPIDQHLPEPKNSFFFPGEEFRSTMKHNFNDKGISKLYLRPDQVNPPYRIPYRALYSRNIDNLFMAGRNVSVTHLALGSTRVMGTTGMMGELVAYAAKLCKKYNCTPRDVYKYHLEELKALLK